MQLPDSYSANSLGSYWYAAFHTGKHSAASSAVLGNINFRELMRSNGWQTSTSAQVTNSIVKASENAEHNKHAERKSSYLAKFENFGEDARQTLSGVEASSMLQTEDEG